MGTIVSCLMPTANRRAHVPRAIACFLGQTYDHRELVILDDGADAVDDLIPDDPRIHYYHSNKRLPHGQKLEWLAQIARGDFFAFWDDDDWHGPARLETQVGALRAGADVVLLERFIGYDLPCGHAYVWDWRSFGSSADGTAAFTRKFYRNGPPFSPEERHPGRAVLLAQPRAKVAWIDGNDLYMQILHDANSATTHMQGAGWIRAGADATVLARERAVLGGAPAAPAHELSA